MPLRLSTALYGKSSKQEEASQRTRRRLSSYISRSKMRGFAGAEASSGPPPWASLPSSLATVFLLQRAEEGKRKRKQCRTEATYTELLTFPAGSHPCNRRSSSFPDAAPACTPQS